MSSFYHYNSHQHAASGVPSVASTHHHSSRGRRAPRLSQHTQKHFRNVRKDEEALVVTAFRLRFEASRSFDLDDDMEFCPNLLTESDIVSIHSGSSDRSSLASASPEASPQSHQVAPDSGFTLNSNSAPYIPSSYHPQSSTLKLHQPSATKGRAIPIINPNTGSSVPSPSPSRMEQLVRQW